MFPFFKPKGQSGAVLQLDRNSVDEKHPDDQPTHSAHEELEAAMHPLLRAIEAKDPKAMAQAFSDALEIAEPAANDESDEY